MWDPWGFLGQDLQSQRFPPLFQKNYLAACPGKLAKLLVLG